MVGNLDVTSNQNRRYTTSLVETVTPFKPLKESLDVCLHGRTSLNHNEMLCWKGKI